MSWFLHASWGRGGVCQTRTVVEEGTGTVPVASIVVATKNRVERVARLLTALDLQTEPRFEVVVVDDGSTDGTSERVEGVARTVGYPVRLLRNDESEGQGTSRNRGWHVATAPVVVFTDDDCVPVPNWLASLLDAMQRDGLDLVSGVTGPPDDQLDQISLWSYVMVDSGRTRALPHLQHRLPTRGARRRQGLRRAVPVPPPRPERPVHDRRRHRLRLVRDRHGLPAGVRARRGRVPRRVPAELAAVRIEHAPARGTGADVQEAPRARPLPGSPVDLLPGACRGGRDRRGTGGAHVAPAPAARRRRRAGSSVVHTLLRQVPAPAGRGRWLCRCAAARVRGGSATEPS